MARSWSSVSAKGKRAQNSSQVPSAGARLGASRTRRAAGGLDELARHVADALLHPRLAVLPGGAAQSVERVLLVGAEARQELDVLDGQVELLVAVVDQPQAVMRGGADGEGLETVVAADAVILVDDEVAFGDLGRFGDELVGAAAAARRPGDALAEKVGLRDEGEILDDEAAVDPQRDEADAAPGIELARVVPALELFGVDVVLAQQGGEAFARASGPGGHDRAAWVAARGPVAGLGREDVEDVAAGLGAAVGQRREDGAGAGAGVDAGGAFGLGEGADQGDFEPGEEIVGGVAVEIEHLGRQRAVEKFAFAGGEFSRLVVVGDHLEAAGEDVVGLVVEADGDVGKIVEQRFEMVVEERGEMFEPGIAAAVGDRLVDAVAGRFGAEGLAPVGAEARDAVGVEGEFGDGVQGEAGEAVAGALGGGVEAANVLDLVAEQVEADGLGFAGGIDVDDAAADRELAGARGRSRRGCSRGRRGTR